MSLSSHSLFTETYRHKDIPRDKRLCKTCTTEIKDEYNFILLCQMYTTK